MNESDLQYKQIVRGIVGIEESINQPTPAAALAVAKRIESNYKTDFSCRHELFDILMEGLLIRLGYRDCVEFIRKTKRFYD